MGHNLALQNSAFDTTTTSGTLSLSVTTPTFGGIKGSTAKTLPTTVTSLTLNPGTGQSPSYSGALGGGTGGTSMSVTKTGLGTQTLSGASLYAGGTALNAGQLNINYGTSSDTTHSAIGVGTFTINGGTIDNTSGSAVTIGPTFTWNWNGSFNVGNSANLALRSGASVVLGADVTVNVNGSGLNPYFGITAPISGSGRKLTKNGGGCMLLSSTTGNSYTGGTVLNAGTFGLYHANSLGTVAGTFTINGGTIHNYTSGLTLVNYPQIWGGDFAFDGGYDLNMGAGAVTLGGNRQVTVGANALTVGGVIDDGVNTYSLTKAGAGALVLNGANTYGGDTRSVAGTLTLGNANALQNSTLDLATTADTGSVGVSGPTSLTLGGLEGARDWSPNIPLSIGNNGQNTIYSAVLKGGSTSLTKIGSGTLTLSGANTYSGNTAISEGTLALSGSGAIAYSPTISVASGATFDVSGVTGGSYSLANGQTLRGSGSVNGNLVAASGAVVAPGASIGTLSFSSDNLTFNAGSAMGVEVNRGASPNADKIQGIATLTEGGTLYVTNSGATLQVNDSFTLLSATTYSGEFAAISPANPNSDTELAWDKPALKTAGLLRVHHVPYATNKTVVRTKGMTAKFKLSELFPSPDPADSDTVVLESFTAGSHSATITSNATYIFYTPANDNSDSFNYTVMDSRGEKRTKLITVNVGAVTGQAQQITVVGGTATVKFAGIPGFSYIVERAADVDFTVNLTTVLTTNLPSDGDGLFTVVDDAGPGSQAYYRLKYNP